MPISKQDVEHIAKLARLTLSEEEIALYSKQLGEILSYVDHLNELDLDDVEPLSHVLDLINVMRDDKHLESLSKEDILAIAPDVERGLYKVPKVINSET